MNLKPLIVLSFVALASCASSGREQTSFNPTSCTQRDFTIYFETGDTEISPAARESIAAVGAALHGCHISHVRIIGSAGAIGGPAASDERAEQRALVLADYLTEHFHWSRSDMEVLATGERGATTDDGLDVPMRRRARITIDAAAP